MTIPHTDFEIITGDVTLHGPKIVKGISTQIMDDNGDVCIVTAPDRKQLENFFKKICGDLLMSETKAKITIGLFEGSEIIPKIWIMDTVTKTCRIMLSNSELPPNTIPLGSVVRGTEKECKIQLRSMGISKEVIDSVTVNL